MASGSTTDDAPADHAPERLEPLGRTTKYSASVADGIAIAQALTQRWLGALLFACAAGALAVIHLVQHRHRALKGRGLGVVMVLAASCLLAGISATTLLTDDTSSASPNRSTPTVTATHTVTATPPAASSPLSSPDPATSAPVDSASPQQPYIDVDLAVPRAIIGTNVEIDFDEPIASTSSLATGTDLRYDNVDGIAPLDGIPIGVGPTKRPSDPNVCVDSAQTQPIDDPTEAETIEVGMAFCVITDEGSIIWFTVTERSQDKYSPRFTFRATMLSR